MLNDAWDEDGDRTPDSNSYWNYECQQLADGSWECSTDHINYYDHCAYEAENYYECWLDEWDTDNDGSYDLGSDGYMDDECEELADGRWACEHAEADHDDHDDEHSPLEEVMEDYMMELLMPMFNESDADNSGGLSLEELEHFIEDIEAMEDDGTDMPTGDYIVAAFDEDGDSMLSYEEFAEMMGMGHDEHHDENETHEGNETHDENASSEEEFMEVMEMMFEMYDANSDGSLDATELDMMFEMMDEDDHHGKALRSSNSTLKPKGNTASPSPQVSHCVLMDGGHEGHDAVMMTTTKRAMTKTKKAMTKMKKAMTKTKKVMTKTKMDMTKKETTTITATKKRLPTTHTAGLTRWPSRNKSRLLSVS